MTGDPIILPVYKPTVHEQSKVMFANATPLYKDELYKKIWTEDIEAVEHCHIHDGETFSYEYEEINDNQAPMVEAVCLDTTQATQVKFADNTYGKIKYSKRGTVTATYSTSFQKKDMQIPVVIDNGASINITPKWYYDKHRALHNLPKTTSNLPPVTTGNGPIKSYFWIDIPIRIQGIYMQLKTLVCGSLAPYGLLLSRMALDQMQVIQLYDKHEILIRQVTIPLRAVKRVDIPVGYSYEVVATLPQIESKCNIQGQSVSWIETNTLGYPLQPVVSTYMANKTVLSFRNNTTNTQTIEKDQLLGYLDMRSKDGSLAELQWLIPIGKDTNDYVFYGHTTFTSSLADQYLAEEEKEKQNLNRFEVRTKPFKSKQDNTTCKDPYPWLDPDDPRREMSDETLMRKKINLNDTVLNEEQKEDVLQMLIDKRDAFSLRDEIGTCPFFEVRLQLRDETPFFVRPYPIREEQKAIVQREMDRLEKLGIIEKGLTGYSSPVLLVKRKQQNLYRVVTDFRVLNERLVRINHAFPLVRDCLDAIGSSDCEVFTVIDLRDAYHTLRLAKESQKFCGITPYYGAPTYHYLRMGMGMSCSPGIWGQFADFIQQQLPNKDRYRIIMDDILIFSTKETHKQDIEDLLNVLIEYGLRISPHKCQMFKDKLVYMGIHFLIQDGKPCIQPMKDKCEAIRSMLPLKTVKECRQFCGMVNFLSTFLPKLREYLIPIYALTKKKATFKWTNECQTAFDKIKQSLQEPPVLRMPAGTGFFRLESDTSHEAAGGALYQLQDNAWVLIGYHSKRLPDAVRNYGVCELELTGLVCNIHGFEHLLKNSYFEVIIDHKAIEYLKRAKYEPTTRRLGALLLKLQDYTFDIKYLEGSKLKVSDTLSRLYAE